MPNPFRVLKNSFKSRLFTARINWWCRLRRLDPKIVGDRFHYFQNQIENAVDVRHINAVGLSGIGSKLPKVLKIELFKEAAFRIQALSETDEELHANLRTVFNEGPAEHYYKQLK